MRLYFRKKNLVTIFTCIHTKWDIFKGFLNTVWLLMSKGHASQPEEGSAYFMTTWDMVYVLSNIKSLDYLHGISFSLPNVLPLRSLYVRKCNICPLLHGTGPSLFPIYESCNEILRLWKGNWPSWREDDPRHKSSGFAFHEGIFQFLFLSFLSCFFMNIPRN